MSSGESGAGKTESTSHLLRYFAARQLATPSPATSLIRQQVLESGPILEAFGNARTLRNDNSSRFGKYIELAFVPSLGTTLGASIQVFLLEKSRVVLQSQVSLFFPLTHSKGERNYHIFYQLMKSPLGSSVPLTNLYYLNQSGCLDIPGVDDAEEFARTKAAMETVGIRAVRPRLKIGTATGDLRCAHGHSTPWPVHIFGRPQESIFGSRGRSPGGGCCQPRHRGGSVPGNTLQAEDRLRSYSQWSTRDDCDAPDGGAVRQHKVERTDQQGHHCNDAVPASVRLARPADQPDHLARAG